MEMVFYVPGQPWVIDFVIERADGVAVSVLHGLTLEEIRAYSPGVIVTSHQEACAQINAGRKAGPLRISAEDYDYVSGLIPSDRRISDGESESFVMGERASGRVTAIYARVGGSYWHFAGIDTMSHSEIITAVLGAGEGQREARAS